MEGSNAVFSSKGCEFEKWKKPIINLHHVEPGWKATYLVYLGYLIYLEFLIGFIWKLDIQDFV